MASLLLNAILVANVLLLGFAVWIFLKVKKLDKIRQEFFASSMKKDLEQVLVDQNRNLTKINQDLKQLADGLNKLSWLNKQNIQKVGLVRFNPFEDTGSNMSFTLALLNDKNNGVVISSLHSRNNTRIYAKAVRAGSSDSKLTDEEKQAIKEAR